MILIIANDGSMYVPSQVEIATQLAICPLSAPGDYGRKEKQAEGED